MDSTYTLGMLLVGLSALLLAMHWQHWRDPQAVQRRDARSLTHFVRLIRRRTVASSLVGLVGVTLMAFESVPRTPLSITAYLLALILMTSWILGLACLDMMANRRFYDEQQLEQIARELRQAELEGRGIDPNNR